MGDLRNKNCDPFHFQQLENSVVVDEPGGYYFKRWNFTLPDNFESDGASAPKLWRRWTGNRFKKPRIFAAIAHDYLYTVHIMSRRDADRFYRDYLIELGYNRFLVYVEYIGVRMFGASHWDL